MTELLSALTAVALGSALVTLAGTGSWRLALRILLDLLTAVGLLRLVGTPTLPELAAITAVVTLRIGLAASLGAGPAVRGSGTGCHVRHCRE